MATVVGDRTLRGLIEYRARATPDHPFLIFDDLAGGVVRFDYAGFDAAVNRAAHVLGDLGIGRGDTVNLHLPNSPAFLLLWFAAAKVGARMMPTNTAASADELEYLINHSGSSVAFTFAAHRDLLEDLRARCPRLGAVVVCDDAGDFDARLAAASDSAPAERPEPGDEVAILYTSGTTARPKGVLVTNASYLYAGETVAKAIRLAPDDRHLVVLPLFHGNAQYYSTMSALAAGASIALTARFSASRFFGCARDHECTVTSLFAAPMRMLLAQPERAADAEHRLRVSLFAQNLTPVQFAEWRRRFRVSVLQLWGMTETMGPPLMNPIDGERRDTAMGLPVLGYEVDVVDAEGVPVPRGEVGEIVVRGIPGESLMKGYLANPEATAETLRDGWLWSGDNARRDEDGFFVFVDRAKDMIKRAGENVAASEVEAVVLAHPAVFDCAVIGVPDPIRDEAIKAYVVPHEGATVSPDEVIDWCRERLASFRVPSEVELRDVLPRTSVGKIQKHVLRAEHAAGAG